MTQEEIVRALDFAVTLANELYVEIDFAFAQEICGEPTFDDAIRFIKANI